MENKKSYYAIIPADVRYCTSLCANAKLLYGEITALCNEKGYCWASNEYFAKLYEVHKNTISKWISALKANGFIALTIENLTDRKIWINEVVKGAKPKAEGGINEKVNTPKRKAEHNNTVNTTKNNTVNIETFNHLWDIYDKKVGKDKAYKAFIKTNKKDYDIIIDHVKEYVDKTPDKQYRKNLATYLNNKSWNDEIVERVDKPKDFYANEQEKAQKLLEKRYGKE